MGTPGGRQLRDKSGAALHFIKRPLEGTSPSNSAMSPISSTTLDVAEGLARPVTELVRAREEGAVGFEDGPGERVGEMPQDAILIGAGGAASLAPRCAGVHEGAV